MKQTQGRRIIAALKRKPMTYLEMHRLGVSTCPHKRVSEQLREDEQIVKARGTDGLVRWRVIGATKWTA